MRLDITKNFGKNFLYKKTGGDPEGSRQCVCLALGQYWLEEKPIEIGGKRPLALAEDLPISFKADQRSGIGLTGRFHCEDMISM